MLPTGLLPIVTARRDLRGREVHHSLHGPLAMVSIRFLFAILRGYGFKGMWCGSHVGVAVSKREFDLRPSTADNIGKSTTGTARVRHHLLNYFVGTGKKRG
jgi:hypothetical protein